MKNKNLPLLTGVVVLAGAYAFYDYQSEQKNLQQKENTAVLLTLKSDQISEINIRNNQQIIHLNRQANEWMLTQPIQEMADNNFVKNFIEDLSKEKIISTISTSNKNLELKTFGLDSPLYEIEMIDNAKTSQKFLISDVKNFEGNNYLKLIDKNDVYVVSSGWSNRATKSLLDFRDKRLLKYDISSIDSIQITADNISPKDNLNSIYIFKQDTDWVLAKSADIKNKKTFSPVADVKKKLDQNKVREILTQVSNTEIKDFMSTGNPDSKQISSLNLNIPLFSLNLNSKENHWKMEIFRNKENIISAIISEIKIGDEKSNIKKLVKLIPPDLEKFQKITLNQLRDRTEPFDFNKNDIQSAVVDSKKIEGEAFKDLIGKLRNMQVFDFIESEKGLIFSPKSPEKEIQILLYSQDLNNPKWSLKIGSKKEISIDGIKTMVYLAKSSSYSDFFWIKENDVKELKLGQ